MRFSFVFYLVFLTLKISGQEFYFKNIGTDQGLSSSETYHSLQDSKGIIWITTDAGICKYDGKNITTYTTKDGLPENVVFNIYEDRNGRIWFNSLSGYLLYYERNRFYTISANTKIKELCNYHPLTSFYIGERDTLYATTPFTFGIIKIPPQSNYKNVLIQAVLPCNHFLISNKLNKNEILIGAVNPIGDNKNHTYTTYNFNNKKLYTLSAKEGCSNLYKGNIDKEGNIYFPRNKELTVIYAKNNTIEYYNFSSEISFIKQDRNGDLWIGTLDGGYFYKNSNLKSKPVYFLKGLSISDVMIDRENSVWVCSLQKGLYKSENKDLLDTYIEKDNICNFYKTSNNLHIGFSSKNESKVNTENNLTNDKLPIESSKLNYLLNNNTYSYYGTNTELLYNKNSRIKIINDNKAKNPHIIVRNIVPIGKDSFAVVSTLETHFIYKDKCFHRVRTPFIVQSIIQLHNKNLLIGSRNNEGIYEYKNDSFYPYFKQYPQLNTRINDLAEDQQGRLWIATNEKGLFCFSNNKFYEFNEKNELNSNKIYDIDIGMDNDVWVATNRGLNKISFSENLKDIKIYSYNESHGLPSLEIEHLTIFNNKVWCAAKEHLFYFDIDKMGLNKTPPLVYIQSVTINEVSYNAAAVPILEHTENNIEFKFYNTSYKKQEQSFLYKLNGYENEWKSSSTAQIQYTNLPYGNYTFQVYALNNDKVKSLSPASFSFTILKPFWLTWWFISFEIILVISFIYLFIRWRVNKIKKQEEEKTRINQKLAEFQMTAIRAQMNPHFIFNAISSIQHYILKNNIYQSYNYLAKFSKLIRNILDNSKEEYITISDEVTSLKLYIELEKVRFKDFFESTIKIDPNLDIESTLIPTMLIQPYIENAIWHGLMPKQVDCKLFLSIEKIENEQLQITIIDNGIGISESKKYKQNRKHVSKGMALIKLRIQSLTTKHEQPFSIDIIELNRMNSDFPTGTKILITVPLIID